MSQDKAEILKSDLCPATLTPSRPCELDHCPSINSSEKFWHTNCPASKEVLQSLAFFLAFLSFFFLSVTHRCFPALDEEEKGMTVQNTSQFNDGSRKNKDAEGVFHGGMWVYLGMTFANMPSQIYLIMNSAMLPPIEHRNDTVVIEFRQVVMKIYEDYTKSWYWILM